MIKGAMTDTSTGMDHGPKYVKRNLKELRMPRSHRLDLPCYIPKKARSIEENRPNGLLRQQPIKCSRSAYNETIQKSEDDKINSKRSPEISEPQISTNIYWQDYTESFPDESNDVVDKNDLHVPEVTQSNEQFEDYSLENHDAFPIEGSSQLNLKNEIPFHIGVEVSQRYKVINPLGSGKFGKVYKVADSENGRLGAAKEIIYTCTKERAEIIKETDILTLMLGNEFILQIYEIIDACHTLIKKMVVITEYLDGGDLFERNASGDQLTEGKVIEIIGQILEGVAFIHSKNIVHRDLKPENIMYPSKLISKIKIIDFGFAVEFDKKNPPKTMVGTTIFVSPEVLNYDCQSFQTDIWSIGVLAYDLLAGITPFEIPRSGDLDRELEEWEIRENIQRCEYDFEDEGFVGISEYAKDFITQILIKQPEKRPTSEQCLDHPWLKAVRKNASKGVLRSVSIRRMKSYIASNAEKRSNGHS